MKARMKAIPTAEREMINRFLSSAKWARKGILASSGIPSLNRLGRDGGCGLDLGSVLSRCFLRLFPVAGL